jgi:hypothetical protein
VGFFLGETEGEKVHAFFASRDLHPPPAPAGGSRRMTREVALLKGASGSCNLKVIFDRRGLHYYDLIRHYNQGLISVT